MVTAGLWKALQNGRVTAPSVAKKPAKKKKKPTAQQGEARAGLRPEATRRRLPLRWPRPQQVGLLRSDHEGLEERRRQAAAYVASSVPGRQEGLEVQPAEGRPGLLLLRHQPRRHLRRQRQDHPRLASRTPVAYIKIKYMPYNGARRPTDPGCRCIVAGGRLPVLAACRQFFCEDGPMHPAVREARGPTSSRSTR